MKDPGFVVVRSLEPMARPAPRGLSLRSVLHVLFKRKWLILSFFLACSAAGVWASRHLTTMRYEAGAQLLVSPADVALPVEGPAAARPAGHDEQVARTVRLLLGRSLAERAVQSIGAATIYPRLAEQADRVDPRALVAMATDRLLDGLEVQAIGRSSIVSIGFVHEDPEMAARVVNAICDLYVERHLNVQRNPRTDAFLEEQAGALKERLARSEAALEELRQRHGIGTTPRDERETVQAELSSVRSALGDARSRQQELQNMIAEQQRRLSVEAKVPRTVYQLQEKVSELELQESELALRVTAQHPTLRELREQLREARERLKRFETVQPHGTAAVRDQTYAMIQTDLARNQAELESAKARQASLAAKTATTKRRLDALDAIEAEFARLQSQVRADEQSYRAYLGTVEAGKRARALEQEKIVGVRVIEPAQPPLYPINASSAQRIRAMSLAAGLVGGVALAFLLHMVGRRLDTGEDVEREIGLPVLASIDRLALPR